MPEQSSADVQQFKILLRSSLAAAAPVVIVFTALITANAVDILQTAHMGRLGLAAAGVLSIGMGFLLWRGRWWAGLPTMVIAAGAAVYFAYKFARPMAAYLAANEFKDVFQAIIMLSPSLVLAVLCIGLCMLIYNGVRLAKQLSPRPVGKGAWILLALWLVLLVGDLVYQQVGWRAVKSPGDLVVRLCQPGVHNEAKNLLLKQGAKAVPTLLSGMAATDHDLGCLRDGSLEVLAAMGSTAVEPLLSAAKEGNQKALLALQTINDPRAAKPLLEIYRNPKPDGDPEFQSQLRKTIKKLNPALNLD